MQGRGALAVGGLLCALASLVTAAAAAAGSEEIPDGADVVLDDVGAGWAVTGDAPVGDDGVVRSYANGSGDTLMVSALPVTTPPGVRAMFQMFATPPAGLVQVPEPSLDLGAWLVGEGSRPGDEAVASLAFASRDHVYVALLTSGRASPSARTGFLRTLAVRQVEAAGGPPLAATSTRDRGGDDELLELLPDEGPDGFGLVNSGTVVGSDEIDGVSGAQQEVADFLNNKSATATRLFSDSGELLVGVSITRYPYDIFAAADLGAVDTVDEVRVVATGPAAGAADGVLFVGEGSLDSQVGTVSRRGEHVARVLVQPSPGMTGDQATALAAAMTEITVSGLPGGGTEPYDFPGAFSKFGGLALAAGIVTAAAAGSLVVARIRARNVRRRWERDGPDAAAMAALVPSPAAFRLDPDARQLRRQGAVLAAAQLLAVNVSIVAVAGEFARTGLIVAAVALVAGLALTRWWQRRELGLLGSTAPPKELVLPRPAGALLGIVALAVIAFGVGYAIKGLQYIVLQPTLAQLKWSDRLDLAPRTVGYVFTVGGFLVAAAGGALFRLARAFARHGTERVLAADARAAALYLRSFDDDRLPLPVIASARRPLFELFSVRGTDPFEESLAWELNSYGPVVAVGRPGRSLASLGAAREHLPDDTWREQVAARMGDAGIIAVATGETAGLAWELTEIVDGGHLDKTFFVFPPVAPADLDRRWRHTARSLVDAGVAVGELEVPVAAVHTVQVGGDGSMRITYATRRDEATYRTAVDRTLITSGEPVPAASVEGRPR